MPKTFGKLPPRTVGDIANAQRERAQRGERKLDKLLAWISYGTLVWAAVVVFHPKIAAAGVVTVARIAGG